MNDTVNGRARILVMDDQDLLRKLVVRMLSSLGYDAVPAADGEESLQLCREAIGNGNPFRVAILDLTIPGGMDGIETLARIREIDPGIKAVASSGSFEDVNQESFRRHGFDGLLNKPYDALRLAQVMRDVLACADSPGQTEA